ncbi:MAG: hypothetical protein ACREMN_03680, partial [Gemmatimonadales bacterium]
MSRHPGLRLPATVLAGALVVAACDAPPTAGPSQPTFRPATDLKTVLVGFQAAPGAAEIALIESFGGEVTYRYKYIPTVAARITASGADGLAADPRVAYVEDDFSMVPLGTRQIIDYGVSLIDAPGAWALG